jgi:hypothetical protein
MEKPILQPTTCNCNSEGKNAIVAELEVGPNPENRNLNRFSPRQLQLRVRRTRATDFLY